MNFSFYILIILIVSLSMLTFLLTQLILVCYYSLTSEASKLYSYFINISLFVFMFLFSLVVLVYYNLHFHLLD